MTGGPPPLRFLIGVLGGWVALRAAMLIPSGTAPPPNAVIVAVPTASPRAARFEPARGVGRVTVTLPPVERAIPKRRASPARDLDQFALPPTRAALVRVLLPPAPPTVTSEPFITPPAPTPPPGRWSGSAWLFVREGEARQLATGGTLGGSQAGGRLLYRLNADPARPLALSARGYAPLDHIRDGEVALGLEWQPLDGVPLRLLFERRQALRRGGRSAFALLGHGGVSDRPLLGALRLDAYGQAGIVGLRSRDLFADGAVRAGLPVSDRVRVGAGIWGAAQPGARRLDVGPHASLRVPIGRARVWVAADWRVRVAGDAEPGSGPALTIASDF